MTQGRRPRSEPQASEVQRDERPQGRRPRSEPQASEVQRDERHVARLSTLVFVRNEDSVLLMRHGPDSDRFAGLWNGVGGHVEAGEDIREAARRELREEAGVDLAELSLRGVIHETGLVGHAYVVFLFVGERPSRELRPAAGVELAWHPLEGLGELPLVGDLPLLLGRLFDAEETLFVTERYDGGDGRLALSIGGVEVGPQAPGGAPP